MNLQSNLQSKKSYGLLIFIFEHRTLSLNFPVEHYLKLLRRELKSLIQFIFQFYKYCDSKFFLP